MTITLSGKDYDVTSPTVCAMRVRAPGLYNGGLDRYGITKTAAETALPAYDCADGRILLKNGEGRVITTVTVTESEPGWKLRVELCDGERLYGLGDVNRSCLDRRGGRYRIWVTNQHSYIPIPYIMSSEGWALTVNTTYEHFVDAGATDRSALVITCPYSYPDFTLYTGKDYAELLYRYTEVSGRPLMLPRWAMGLTFVCNTRANAYELVNDGLNFRREDIPCDILGLEPGWMEKNYDDSVDKKWSNERFYIPPYAQKGPTTFLGAVDRLKFKLSLWLCCNYDLTIYEERLLKSADKPNDINADGYATAPDTEFFEDDEHFHNPSKKMDTVTDPNQCWFEHLKKFVDQGVSAFKLDGAWQVLDHPDRLYGNGMTDKEAHNLYPILLAKQMSLGFTEHTGKRAMIYTAGGYTGIQQYAATWAGDTGGGFGALVSMLNNSICGHSNVSCDLDVFSTESIHFGFLQAWSQVNSWNYWRHPWLLEDDDKEIFREYDKLRYSLFPYIYTAAAQAYESGMPIMRPLPLVYPKDENTSNILNAYMFGDNLLVGVFLGRSEREIDGEKVNMYLPDGKWYDYFTGEKYEGGRWIFYVPPKRRGGALFVKEGSAIPTVESGKYISSKVFDEIKIKVWPDESGNAYGRMYEDDGVTPDYRDGAFRKTEIKVEGDAIKVTQTGTYDGMPEVRFTLV